MVSFIVAECDECAANLPVSYADEPGAQIGRVTKGFAMAVKAKALLYAASPLHNETGDIERWKSSAKAALAIIESGVYSLDPDGCVNEITSPEVVMVVIGGDSQDFELKNFPIRFTEGKRTGATATFPSQNLVDAFETVNGHKVTLEDFGWVSDDPQFNPQRPYDNRDPRFARTVLADGMPFKGSAIESFEGGADHAEVTAGGSPTGYFLRKYIQESTSFVPDKTVTNKHHWIVYRYAEALLTYAESMLSVTYLTNFVTAGEHTPLRVAKPKVRVTAGVSSRRDTPRIFPFSTSSGMTATPIPARTIWITAWSSSDLK